LGARARVLEFRRGDEATLEQGLHPLRLSRVVVGHGARLREVGPLVFEVRSIALERRTSDLEPCLAGLERGTRLVDGGTKLEIIDLGEDLAGLHEVAPLGVDPADVAGHLREDRRLLRREDVGRERELDLEIATLGRERAHQHIRPDACHRARLLILDAIDDEDAHEDEKTEDREAYGVTLHEAHPMKSPVSTGTLYGASAGSQ